MSVHEERANVGEINTGGKCWEQQSAAVLHKPVWQRAARKATANLDVTALLTKLLRPTSYNTEIMLPKNLFLSKLLSYDSPLQNKKKKEKQPLYR